MANRRACIGIKSGYDLSGAHEPPKAANERRTSYAGASERSTYSRVPKFYLIWQEAVTYCSSKDLCETEVITLLVAE